MKNASKLHEGKNPAVTFNTSTEEALNIYWMNEWAEGSSEVDHGRKRIQSDRKLRKGRKAWRKEGRKEEERRKEKEKKEKENKMSEWRATFTGICGKFEVMVGFSSELLVKKQMYSQASLYWVNSYKIFYSTCYTHVRGSEGVVYESETF